jgi:hypothetical protein
MKNEKPCPVKSQIHRGAKQFNRVNEAGKAHPLDLNI